MKSIERYLMHIYGEELSYLRVWDNMGIMIFSFGGAQEQEKHRRKILFEKKELGMMEIPESFLKKEELNLRIAPFLYFPVGEEKIWQPRLERMHLWIEKIEQLFPGLAHWIGIYLKEEALMGFVSHDLVLGPFIGEVTEHVRIPIDKGICGMAVREECAVNVPNVALAPAHIACSLKTKSELVIPLEDQEGKIVAELDLDSEALNAFTHKIEARLLRVSQNFFQEVWEN